MSIHCRCFGDVDELCDLVIHMVHLARTQQEYRHGLQRQVGSVLRSILAQLQDDDSQDLCKAWAQVHARLARLGVPEDLWPDQEELANASPKASQEGHFLLKGVWRSGWQLPSRSFSWR
ncbi:hypothetical protein KJ766_03925 [Patescibacteria group bacterium]|nr:hypothetical protein [Patescibacteria group bacterium]